MASGGSPITATGGNIGASTAATFVFSTVPRSVDIVNRSSSSELLVLVGPSGTASTTNWHYFVGAGQILTLPFMIDRLSIFNTGASTVTYGTDFNVIGWL
ncbi:MAG: hypothetical protein D6681_20200 [Calditrichaeota bacterium]|nr:MAG: hypothetical protein D6681_20200 [Calditrichota bacterium]